MGAGVIIANQRRAEVVRGLVPGKGWEGIGTGSPGGAIRIGVRDLVLHPVASVVAQVPEVGVEVADQRKSWKEWQN